MQHSLPHCSCQQFGRGWGWGAVAIAVDARHYGLIIRVQYCRIESSAILQCWPIDLVLSRATMDLSTARAEVLNMELVAITATPVTVDVKRMLMFW